MKVNLQKKRAITAAMLLTMCCCGQAWAATVINDDITINAGEIKTIGTAGEDLTINSSNIHLNNGVTAKIEGINLTFSGGCHSIEGQGTVDINTDKINFSGSTYDNININADIVKIKISDNMFINWVGMNINQAQEYKNAITQIEGEILMRDNCYRDSETSALVQTININFTGPNSYFKGHIYPWMDAGVGVLTFDNGAHWIVSL